MLGEAEEGLGRYLKLQKRWVTQSGRKDGRKERTKWWTLQWNKK